MTVARLCALALVGAVLGGCGSSAPSTPSGGSGSPGAATPRRGSAPGNAPNPAALQVIRAWSDTLRRGDIAGAARLFALPSAFQNGPDQPLMILRREADARGVTGSLPCGARLLRAAQEGRFVNALFVLTQRPGANCGQGVGLTARTAFVIRAGKILEWRRAPDQPGDQRLAPPVAPRPPLAPRPHPPGPARQPTITAPAV